MPPIRSIQIRGTKQPAGHYSQGIVHDGLVYVSGQLPMDLATGTIVAGSVEAQTELALDNVRRVLETGGSGLDRVIQMTVYVNSMESWPAVNATYARIMGTHRPARAIVPSPGLHYDVALEIQAIGSVRPKKRPARATKRTPRSRPVRRRRAA
ncbi:MAG: RidA family protein [Gemmatimonadales bacterium]